MITDKSEILKRFSCGKSSVWINLLGLIVFMVFGAHLLDPLTVSAASITGSPKLSIPTSSTEIGSDYTFVPTFGDNSTVSTFGSGNWRKINQNKEGRENWNHQWWAINLDTAVNTNANLKGKIGVKYTKVGSFNGQELDLMIYLTNWDPYFKQTGNISFNTSDIEMYSQGYEAVDMEWRYVKSGTTTEVKVSGYLTFGDVDAAQGIRFNQATSNNIQQVMIPSNNSKLLYKAYNNGYWYYVDDPYDTPELDRSPLYRFTILYSGQSRLNLTWTVNYKNQGVTDTSAWGFTGNYNTTRANGQFFYYEYDKPARTAIANPSKTVSTDNLGSESSEQTIKNIYNTTKFTVKHNVPKEPSKYFFTNYKMTDTIHKGLVPTGTVVIKNQSGTNVTNWFDVNVNGQVVTANAKATTLKNNAFYGGTYQFIIDTKSVSADKYNEFLSGNKATVTNKATITVNNKTYTSNEVKANMYKRTITIKHVNKDTGSVLATETDKRYDGETPTYIARSDLKDSNNKAYRSLTANQKITVSKDETITFYYDSPRKITVNHVDNDTGKLIDTITDYKYESESYSYSPKTDLAFNSTHNYRVVSAYNKTLSGTIGKADLILTFKYVGPRLITVQHINKDTGEVLTSSTEYKYDGDLYEYKPKTDIKFNSDFMYQPVSDSQETGTVAGQPLTIKFYYTPPRTITIRHIDDRDNHVISSSTEMKHDRQEYSYKPRTDLLFNSKYLYSALTGEQKGIVSGKNIVVDFVYDLPNADLSLNKIQIYTAKADAGLPVKLTFTIASLGDSWSADKVTIGVYNKQSGKSVSSKEFTLEQLSKGISMKIPSDKLDVNTNNVYEARIEKVDPLAVYVDPNKSVINTKGYTSSEKDIVVSAAADDKLFYDGVIMTEREIGKEIIKYNETLSIPLEKIEPVKSGYGIDLSKNITYTNELNNLKVIKAEVVIDKKLIDTYLEFPISGNKASINYHSEDESVSGTTMKQTIVLPKVYVEEKTGSLFSEEQVSKEDKRIKFDLKDGGNKLYIPIWVDSLGSYPISVQSIEPIGVNEITFDIKDTIDIKAFMYGYIGSKTIEKDEIMIEPVNISNPFPNGLPKGWTQKDLEWLKK